MLMLVMTSTFKKDYKTAIKRKYNMPLLDNVLQILLEEKTLPPKYFDHPLTGNYAGFRECHIQPDWLLIYRIDGKELILIASRTGTHSDLF